MEQKSASHDAIVIVMGCPACPEHYSGVGAGAIFGEVTVPKNAGKLGTLVSDFLHDLDDHAVGPLVSDFVHDHAPEVRHIVEHLGPLVSDFVQTLTAEVPPADNIGHQVSDFVHDWLI
jgi:hypothetical protein